MSTGSAVPMRTALDHLLLGVADLDRGIAWIERLTGVKAAVGGSHPGRGTRNALISFGTRQYLEIIGPDPVQTGVTDNLGLASLTEPRLINWAAATRDIDGLAARARQAGREVFGPRDGSRVRPDGRTLKWRTLGVASTLKRGVVDPIPFFIEWDPASRHPSEDSPTGCTLESLRVAYPTPADVVAALSPFDVEPDVAQSPNAALIAALKTPKGVIELK
jgi:Glyoxalase-like domain